MGLHELVLVGGSLFLAQTNCAALYYFFVTDETYLIPLEIFNIVLIAINNLFLLATFVGLLYYAQQKNHQQVFSLIASKVSLRNNIFLLLVSALMLIFSCCCTLYSIFHIQQTSDPLKTQWTYLTSSFLCFVVVIYLTEIVKIHKGQQKGVNYCMYLLVLFLGLIYISQVAIYSQKTTFGGEVNLQLVLIFYSLNVWWKQTPLTIHLATLVCQVIDIHSSIQSMKRNSYALTTFSFEIAKLLLLFSHSVYVIVSQIVRLYRCLKSTDVKVDLPMKLSAINCLEKVKITLGDVSRQDLRQLYEVTRRQQECSICMKEMKQGEFIYMIPCEHQFHCECLKEWLLHKNSCPKCRMRVG